MLSFIFLTVVASICAGASVQIENSSRLSSTQQPVISNEQANREKKQAGYPYNTYSGFYNNGYNTHGGYNGVGGYNGFGYNRYTTDYTGRSLGSYAGYPYPANPTNVGYDYYRNGYPYESTRFNSYSPYDSRYTTNTYTQGAYPYYDNKAYNPYDSRSYSGYNAYDSRYNSYPYDRFGSRYNDYDYNRYNRYEGRPYYPQDPSYYTGYTGSTAYPTSTAYPSNTGYNYNSGYNYNNRYLKKRTVDKNEVGVSDKNVIPGNPELPIRIDSDAGNLQRITS